MFIILVLCYCVICWMAWFLLNRPTTLKDAMAACVAGRGDTIFILPGSIMRQNTPITLDKASVSIIGLGQHDARPTFLMDGYHKKTMYNKPLHRTGKRCL